MYKGQEFKPRLSEVIELINYESHILLLYPNDEEAKSRLTELSDELIELSLQVKKEVSKL